MAQYYTYAFFGIIFLIIIAHIIYTNIKNGISLKAKVRKMWGKYPDKALKAEELESIKSHFVEYSKIHEKEFFIDDITWNDLDMDKIYMKLNNTCSTAGEEALYLLLRNPSFEKAQLEERDRMIELLRKNVEDRNNLGYALFRLGKPRFLGVSDYIYTNVESHSKQSYVYKALVATLLICLVLCFWKASFLFGVLLLIIINSVISMTIKKEISSYLEPMGYLVGCVSACKKIAKLNIIGLEELSDKMNKTASQIKSFSFGGFFIFFYISQDMFIEMVKSIFLIEAIAFTDLFKTVKKYKAELAEIYETVGFLDSMRAVASYRDCLSESIERCEVKNNNINNNNNYNITNNNNYNDKINDNDYSKTNINTNIDLNINTNINSIPNIKVDSEGLKAFCTPEFEDNGIHGLNYKNIYHPLINNPIKNSHHHNKSALITGSNASGKSTFLKTLAINVLFAQTIHMVLADSYQGSFFRIFSSMALRDSLENGESYYIVEIKALKRIIDTKIHKYPMICIIDEVLRGTNTVERIAASAEILGNLCTENILCLAATHDIELTRLLEDRMENLHFQEQISENGIYFDYKLYEGKSRSRNAIKLLGLLGFEKEIVEKAETRAQEFTTTGNWSN